MGTGRFAAPLGIDVGVDPASAMLRRARSRGVRAIRAVGEELPLRSGCFDRVLIALTLCFLDSPEDALSEVGRVLRPHGRLVLAYLDPTSPAGRAYARDRTGRFYENAVLRTPEEIEDLLGSAGFTPARTVQTLTRPPEEMDEPERPRPGRGEGMFVVVQALPHSGANQYREP